MGDTDQEEIIRYCYNRANEELAYSITLEELLGSEYFADKNPRLVISDLRVLEREEKIRLLGNFPLRNDLKFAPISITIKGLLFWEKKNGDIEPVFTELTTKYLKFVQEVESGKFNLRKGTEAQHGTIDFPQVCKIMDEQSIDRITFIRQKTDNIFSQNIGWSKNTGIIFYGKFEPFLTEQGKNLLTSSTSIHSEYDIDSKDQESENLEYFVSFESLKKKMILDARRAASSINKTSDEVEQKIRDDMARGVLEFPRKSHLYILIKNLSLEFIKKYYNNLEKLEKGHRNLLDLKTKADKFTPIILRDYYQDLKEQSDHLNDNVLKLENALKDYLQFMKEASKKKEKVDETFKMSKIKVLLLGSQYQAKGEVLVGEEIRKLRKTLEKYKDLFEFRDEPAIRRREIALKISSFKPNIIHFSGHGTSDTGPLFNGDEIHIHSFDLKLDLIEILKQNAKDSVKLIIFNVCDSEKIAQEVVNFIDYSIGTKSKINDDFAPQFSKGFYSILGNKESIKLSFENGKKLYIYKYNALKGNNYLTDPYKIFPESDDEDFGDFIQVFGDLSIEVIANQSDEKTNPEEIKGVLEQRKQKFEETIRNIRKNQFNMRITINSDKLFDLSNYEPLIKFLNEQRDLIPVLDESYGSLRIYDSFNVDSFGIRSFSNNEYIGSSLRIAREGFILYNLHINFSQETKILQVSYMAAHIIGLLDLCYRLYEWLNYSRKVDISINIDNISDWFYRYPGEERKLKQYQHEEFSTIKLSFQLDEIKDGMSRYAMLDKLIRELMIGYGCYQTHKMPNLSDFRKFYEGDDNDLITY